MPRPRPGFHVFTLSIDEKALDEMSRTLEHRAFEELVGGREVLELSPAGLAGLREALAGFVRGYTEPAALSEGLLRVLVATREPGPPAEGPRARDRALRRSLEMVEAHERGGLSVTDLCRETGVSRRTLENAFRERFALSPKSYMMARRLQRARRELVRSPGGRTVTQVAGAWGFTHMSQFAGLYRRQFGELPSETLRAARS